MSNRDAAASKLTSAVRYDYEWEVHIINNQGAKCSSCFTTAIVSWELPIFGSFSRQLLVTSNVGQRSSCHDFFIVKTFKIETVVLY